MKPLEILVTNPKGRLPNQDQVDSHDRELKSINTQLILLENTISENRIEFLKYSTLAIEDSIQHTKRLWILWATLIITNLSILLLSIR